MDEGSGRGRGRGRGAGVPLLPSGVWDELNRSKPTSTITATISNQNQFASADEGNGKDDVSQTVERVEVGAFHDQPSIYLNGPDSNGVIAEAAVANTNDGNSNAVDPTTNALEMLPGMDAYGGYTNGTGINAGGGFGRGRVAGRGGRGMMSGARGGLKRDVKGPDWDCPSCTNVNWSWRSNCNKCNTAKPVSILSENEMRDGAGGGFNERQERVSAATVEVAEDGFDDFGRRAKNGNGNNNSNSGQYRQVVDHSVKERKEKAALERLKATYGFLLPQSMDSSSNNNSMEIPTSSGQYQDAETDGDNKNRSNRRDDKSVDNFITSIKSNLSGSNSNVGSSSSSSSRHKSDDRDRDNKDSSNKHRSATIDGRSDRDREKDRDRNDRDRDRERGRERECSDRGGVSGGSSSNNRNDIRGSTERGSERNTTSNNDHRDRSRGRDRNSRR